MSMTLIELEDFDPPTDSAGIEYPDCDGNLMSDNTTHGDAIEYVAGVARTVVQSDPNAFSAADHLWYYRQGDPTMRVAPDVYVVFGRPKGHRGRYLQWAEDGIAPQFVFEVVSPNNRAATAAKVFLYDELGVDEYVIYDPGYDRDGDLDVSKRSLRGRFVRFSMVGYVSGRPVTWNLSILILLTEQGVHFHRSTSSER